MSSSEIRPLIVTFDLEGAEVAVSSLLFSSLSGRRRKEIERKWRASTVTYLPPAAPCGEETYRHVTERAQTTTKFATS